jgi:polyferredoxin
MGIIFPEKTGRKRGVKDMANPLGSAWPKVRRILQAQLVIAFLVTVMIMKQWWFCVMMLGLGAMLSVLQGKVWCGMLCPNGGLADLVWSRVSLRLFPFPNWLGKGNVLRALFVGGMIAWFAGVVWYVNVHLGLPVAFASYDAHGWLFLRFCQSMILLAAVMGIVFEPRAFCLHVCPGGTLGTLLARAAKRSPVALDVRSCVGCRACTKACHMPDRLLEPLLNEAAARKARGEDSGTLPVSSSCFGCLGCVAACPRGAIRLNEAKRREEHGDGEKKTFLPGA